MLIYRDIPRGSSERRFITNCIKENEKARYQNIKVISDMLKFTNF